MTTNSRAAKARIDAANRSGRARQLAAAADINLDAIAERYCFEDTEHNCKRTYRQPGYVHATELYYLQIVGGNRYHGQFYPYTTDSAAWARSTFGDLLDLPRDPDSDAAIVAAEIVRLTDLRMDRVDAVIAREDAAMYGRPAAD